MARIAPPRYRRISSYSLDDASVHSHLIRGWLGSLESVTLRRRFDRFSHSAELTGVADTETLAVWRSG